MYIPSVRAGSDLSDSGGTITNISNQFGYDIAILVFQNPITFSSTIQPVKLSTNNDILAPGMRGTVSGFGQISFSGPLSKLLKATQVTVKDFEWCKNQYHDEMFKHYQIPFTEMVFCAGGDMDNITDSCEVDFQFVLFENVSINFDLREIQEVLL
ncbi:unnamed protein product [Ceutorhynchus assimilis]|uniref:Peptidase S1 domain-containing protein n=1 Tax=Ceutorhynchus assimilis TaxID=467358 RepID=A0A9N9QFC0_9CUCU|nr:unnamed protein product [Ceutorhynchus assimilis]